MLKSDCQNFEIQNQIGRGLQLSTNKKVIMKILRPVRQEKIKREIKILQIIKQGPCIVKLIQTCLNKATQTPILVFKYFSNQSLKTITNKLNLEDIKLIIYQIFKALDYAHSKGIMHRDVKPSNIIINSQTKEVQLIDWGLSEFYIQGQQYHTRVSSRPYKSPELLIGLKLYDFSLDIWSLGCTFAGLIFQQRYFFRGQNDFEQLRAIVKVLGTKNFFKYLQKCQIQINKDKIQDFQFRDQIQFEQFITEQNVDLCTPEAIDLLNKMLVYDHEFRITAKKALQHQFFNSIKTKFN